MTYKHKPMSQILAPAGATAEDKGEAKPAPKEESKGTELPEKYRGKTAAEIADMHMNAEQELGRVRNEVGSMRGLISDLSAIQRPAVGQPAEEVSVEVSGDELIADPVASIRKVVKLEQDKERAINDADALEAQISLESNALVTEFGDINTIVGNPEFQKFATRTRGRQEDYSVAANGKGLDQVRAARRLLEDYADFTTVSNDVKVTQLAPTPTEQARAVSTEGTGAVATAPAADQIYESDVITLINEDPAKYRSPSYQAGLLKAIKEDPALACIPVVVLTTSNAEQDVLKSYNLHANAYITKPVDFDHFIKVVQTIEEFWLVIVTLPKAA